MCLPSGWLEVRVLYHRGPSRVTITHWSRLWCVSLWFSPVCGRLYCSFRCPELFLPRVLPLCCAIDSWSPPAGHTSIQTLHKHVEITYDTRVGACVCVCARDSQELYNCALLVKWLTRLNEKLNEIPVQFYTHKIRKQGCHLQRCWTTLQGNKGFDHLTKAERLISTISQKKLVKENIFMPDSASLSI